MTGQVFICNWIKTNYVKSDPFVISGYYKM